MVRAVKAVLMAAMAMEFWSSPVPIKRWRTSPLGHNNGAPSISEEKEGEEGEKEERKGKEEENQPLLHPFLDPPLLGSLSSLVHMLLGLTTMAGPRATPWCAWRGQRQSSLDRHLQKQPFFSPSTHHLTSMSSAI